VVSSIRKKFKQVIEAKGYEIEKIEDKYKNDNSDLDTILQIRKYLVGESEENVKFFDNWMATLIQTPQHPTRCALVLKSDEGCGKGSFLRMIGKMIGSKYFRMGGSPKYMFGEFNQCMEGKLLVVVDEMSKKDGKTYEDRIKEAVTEPTLGIRYMRVDGVKDTNNYANLVFPTNKNSVVRVSSSDRRFCIFTSTDLTGNTEYKDLPYKDKKIIDKAISKAIKEQNPTPPRYLYDKKTQQDWDK